jgi:hypothetical protein
MLADLTPEYYEFLMGLSGILSAFLVSAVTLYFVTRG